MLFERKFKNRSAKIIYRGFKQIKERFYYLTVIKKDEEFVEFILKDYITKKKYIGEFNTKENFFFNTYGKELIDFLVDHIKIDWSSKAQKVKI